MAHAPRESTEVPPPRGVIRSPRADGLLEGRRVRPSSRLAPYVHHFWSVRWALRSPFKAEILSYPAAKIMHDEMAGRRRATVMGVQTDRHQRCLTGEGQTFGITFRAGMFQPLSRTSMASLTDRVVPLDRVLGSAAEAWTNALLEAPEVDDKVAIAEAFLGPLLPPLNPRLVRFRDLVERMAVDRSILRVEDASEAAGLDVRALQRSFQTYVGVSPKWVLQRYRLQEAAVQLAGPHPPTLAALAASLGYADQAHFGRDFKRTVGQTPRSFERSAAALLASGAAGRAARYPRG